jgi:hypothetical protein
MAALTPCSFSNPRNRCSVTPKSVDELAKARSTVVQARSNGIERTFNGGSTAFFGAQPAQNGLAREFVNRTARWKLRTYGDGE